MATAIATPTSFKLGRTARSHDSRVPQLHNLLAGKPLPPAPAQLDYTKGMPANLGIMKNDTLGDCTCAAYYHAIQVWSYNAKTIDTEPDIDVVLLYEQACGYNPKQGGEGPGGNEQKVLTFLLNTGAPFGPTGTQRHKISAFVEVPVNNIGAIKTTIQDCGVCYIGFNVPKYMMGTGNGPLPVWDVEPHADNTIIGGHAVVLAGYDANGIRLISWGSYYTMTWAFFEKFVDEAYGIADSDWFAQTGKNLAGLTLPQLEAAMQQLKG